MRVLISPSSRYSTVTRRSPSVKKRIPVLETLLATPSCSGFSIETCTPLSIAWRAARRRSVVLVPWSGEGMPRGSGFVMETGEGRAEISGPLLSTAGPPRLNAARLRTPDTANTSEASAWARPGGSGARAPGGSPRSTAQGRAGDEKGGAVRRPRARGLDRETAPLPAPDPGRGQDRRRPLRWASRPSRGTSWTSPLASSFTWQVPACHSRSPAITTRGIPRRSAYLSWAPSFLGSG